MSYEDWQDTAEECVCLALIILLDQFSRNLKSVIVH